MNVCTACGREHKRGGLLCPRCYMTGYRATPEGRARVRQANAAAQSRWWDSLTPEQRLQHGRNRRARVALDTLTVQFDKDAARMMLRRVTPR